MLVRFKKNFKRLYAETSPELGAVILLLSMCLLSLLPPVQWFFDHVVMGADRWIFEHFDIQISMWLGFLFFGAFIFALLFGSPGYKFFSKD